MSEITPNQDALTKIASLLKQRQGSEGDAARTSNFSDILSQRLDDDQDKALDNAESLGSLPELEASLAVRLSQAHGSTDSDLVQNISQTLDLLDTYAQCLADPGNTLRQADELLGQITTSIQDMAGQSESESDTRIQDILNHLSTLVAVEKIKMDRGDYT